VSLHRNQTKEGAVCVDLDTLGFATPSVDESANVTHVLVFLCPLDENSREWHGRRITGSFQDDREAVAILCNYIPDLVRDLGKFGGFVIIKSIVPRGTERDRTIQIFLVINNPED
jgi:hypothetical protein